MIVTSSVDLGNIHRLELILLITSPLAWWCDNEEEEIAGGCREAHRGEEC